MKDLYLSSMDTWASSSTTDLQDEPAQEQTTPDITGIKIYRIFNSTAYKQLSKTHFCDTNTDVIHKQHSYFHF